MSNMRLSIDDRGTIRHVDAPARMKTKDFIKELLEELHPEAADERLDWELYDEGGEALDSDQTLEENGAQPGRHLYLRPHQKKAVTCHSCNFENAPGHKFCQRCGKPLIAVSIPASAATSAAAPPPAPASAPVQLKLHVHMPDERSHSAEVPSRMKVSELIEDLVVRFNLPSKDVSAGKATWRLDDADTSKSLDPQKSLQENGARSGQDLYLRLVIEPNGRLPWWKIAVGVGALVLVALAAFLIFRPKPVTVTPQTTRLNAGQAQKFSADVSGENKAVQWSIVPSDAAAGAISQNGEYTAPSAITAERTVTVTATSVAEPKNSGRAEVILLAANMPSPSPVPSPTLGPSATATPKPVSVSLRVVVAKPILSQGERETFSAVVNGTDNREVSWNASEGEILPNGSYQAPNQILKTHTVEIAATSRAAPKPKSAGAVITLNSPIEVKITNKRDDIALKPDKGLTFEVNMTGSTTDQSVAWSINPADGGNISPKKNKADYHSPKKFNPKETEVKVTVKSNQDPSKSDSVTVKLVPK